MDRNNFFTCFGQNICTEAPKSILQEIENRANQNLSTWIVTANPEILLYAKKHQSYWDILQKASLRIVDGTGLKFCAWLAGKNVVRFQGVDLAESLVQMCFKNNWSIGLIGGQGKTAQEASWELKRLYPNLKIITEQGGQVDELGNFIDKEAEDSIIRLREYQPDIILVAFGHPKQDFWIYKHNHEFPETKVFVGVGGTFDFWSNNIKRAPELIQIFGLEWLWRLIKEPRRWKRIFNAVVIFPITVLKVKFSKTKNPS